MKTNYTNFGHELHELSELHECFRAVEDNCVIH